MTEIDYVICIVLKKKKKSLVHIHRTHSRHRSCVLCDSKWQSRIHTLSDSRFVSTCILISLMYLYYRCAKCCVIELLHPVVGWRKKPWCLLHLVELQNHPRTSCLVLWVVQILIEASLFSCLLIFCLIKVSMWLITNP